MTDARLWPAERNAAARLLDFFLLEKAFYEIEYELAHRPDWLHVPLAGTLRILSRSEGSSGMSELPREAYAIIEGRHADPFHYLGPHIEKDVAVVRVFLPDAEEVRVVDEQGHESELERIHDAGLFAGRLPNGSQRYQLRARFGENVVEMEDPYRFPPVLSEFDLYLLAEGTHLHLYEKLGAHPMTHRGRRGRGLRRVRPRCQARQRGRRFQFVGRPAPCHARARQRLLGNLRPASQGRRQIQIRDHRTGRPDAAAEVRSRRLRRRGAPQHRLDRRRPRCGAAPAPAPEGVNALSAPISIYEVHLGSWRRRPEDGNRWLTYRELAAELPAYVRDLGFTHVEFMPVTEHPFDGSWGYQPTGLFAPTSRFGTPADFAALVDACHRAGLAVLLDWVPGHFPDDPHGLAQFDGTALYEHANPLQGRHLDWGTLIYNYGRTEVANFLLASGLFWLDRYRRRRAARRCGRLHALSRLQPAGGRLDPEQIWRPRKSRRHRFPAPLQHGGFRASSEATTAAEESTAWPMVSRPVDWGGLGFGYKWNMGWMHDTLDYISKDPIYRRHHHGQILFGLHYAFSENFILPLSHDEVVHGKRSILGRMPGDDWQRFANLRAYYGFMFGHPGKKLMFMGSEFGQEREWSHDHSLDWHLLENPQARRRPGADSRSQQALSRRAGAARARLRS